MKILFVNTGPWGTGSFTATWCLATRFLQKGHQVKIFFPDANLPSSDRQQYYDRTDLFDIWQFPITQNQITLPVFPLMIPDPNPRNLQGITFKSLTEAELNLYLTVLEQKLSRTVEQFQPDIIHCHHIWYPGSIISKMPFPYVVTAHHSDQMGFRYDERVRESAKICANGADRVIAISDLVQEEIKNLYGIAPQKISLLPNSFDDDIFQVRTLDKAEIFKKWNLPCDVNAPIVNFTGKLSLTKGMDLLLQANKLLPSELNIQILVLGTGKLDDLYPHMEKNSWSLKNMHFLGQQPPQTVAEIHNISDFSVMPSRSEGFGIAALEAMGCGLPVIATRCGGPEQFAVGRLIENESPKALADSIVELAQMPRKNRQALGLQALEKSREYSASVTADAHLDLYKNILGTRHGINQE